jgi:hypothetical protein
MAWTSAIDVYLKIAKRWSMLGYVRRKEKGYNLDTLQIEDLFTQLFPDTGKTSEI